MLYLCTNEDLIASENPDLDTDGEENLTSEDERGGPSEKKLRFIQVESDEMDERGGPSETETLRFNRVENDEMLARQLQSELDNSEHAAPTDQSSPEVHANNEQDSITNRSASQEIVQKFDSCSYLISCLKEKVNKRDQFFIVVRRGSSLQQYLTIWQREAKRNSPENLLRVHFAGEVGIDTGAMSKEFLSSAIDYIRSQMFPNGSPTDSVLYAHKGFFYICGQICLVSIVQGGPPPYLFEERVYQMLINQEVDVNQLTAVQHLTKHEKEMLEGIGNDPNEMQDTILEHGYTGPISTDHCEAITGTVILSIVSNRLLYLKEVKRGLDHYGFLSVLQNNADLCKEPFIINQDQVDANYVLSLLCPQFSEKGTSKRAVEETVFDHLHDFILAAEDTTVTGYTEELPYDHDDTEDVAGGEHKQEGSPEIKSADISSPGVLGWLTGQRHRHLMEKSCLSLSSLTTNVDKDIPITRFAFLLLECVQETLPCQWCTCKMRKNSKGSCC